MRPKIGITLDWQKEGTFSTRPHYALREHYFDIVYAAGGLPLGIPYMEDAAGEYVNMFDGIVVPGGFFASPDSWYITSDGKSPYDVSPRLQFDMDIIELALKADKPLFGICAGMQLMGGVASCKMTHDIGEYIKTDIDHLNEKPAEEYAHSVKVSPKTLLSEIVGVEEFAVNTAHREAIVEISGGVVINAISSDGVIEGIEFPGKKFALGVQWHPEFFKEKSDPSFKIFEAFVESARG